MPAAIELTITHSPLAFIYEFFTPTVEINGTKQRLPWGTHTLEMPPGAYTVAISYPWLFAPECGKNTVRFELKQEETKRVAYRAGLIRFVPGKMHVS